MMNPTKLLIAQRLAEHAREGRAIVSLMPRAGTAAEQDHMIYGKRKNTPMDLPYFNQFSHSIEIESW